MGQAKRRGSLEVRIQQSIERKEMTRQVREAAEAAWWNSLTDEQKSEYRAKRERGANAARTATALSGLAYYPY